MPDETLIAEIETILAEVVELGAAAERTRMVPNLLVTDAAPTGLTGFVTIADDRDGDNILAKKVPGVIYSTNDLVNVLFIRGGEAIAFQQGSQSSNAGLWQIVDGTSTDIFYNSGDVGIGKNVAPDARLELLDTAQAQLRLTFEEDTKFADFTVDTNHDLTIKPSSTGQVILQPTTDSTDFFQVLDAAAATVVNVDTANKKVRINTANTTYPLEVSDNMAVRGTSNNEILVEVTGAGNFGTSYRAKCDDATALFGAFNSGYTTVTEYAAKTVFQGGDFFALAAATASGEIQFYTGGRAAADRHLVLDSDGKLGLGTNDIPHGAVGAAKFAIDGTNGSAAGPHIQVTTASDNYPIFQMLNWGHDNISLNFDAYFNGTNWLSGDAGSNYQLYKVSDKLTFLYDSGVAQGGTITWNTGLTLDTSGLIGINGVTSPSTELDIGDGAIEFEEMTAPGAGAANTARLYAVDDGSGNTALETTAYLSLPDTIYHTGDTDNKIGFSDDTQTYTVGGVELLKLTEAAQDVVDIGDVAGTGDVDIDFNNGDMFLRGSDGFLGLGVAAPTWQLHIVSSSQVRIKAQNDQVNGNCWFSMQNDAIEWLMGCRGDTSDIFTIFDNSAGGFDEVLSIAATTGYVGLNGITSPSTELDIGDGAIEFEEMTAPGAGAANTARLYAVDNGAGKTQLVVIFNTGAAQVLATQP